MKTIAFILLCLQMITCSLKGVSQENEPFSLRKTLKINVEQIQCGPFFHYVQGKDGFMGGGVLVTLDETEDNLAVKHWGLAVGSDFKLSRNFLMVPQVSLEYRCYPIVARMGYLCYTDFGRMDQRLSAEIGVSFFGLMDLTYLRTFSFGNNPFHLGNNYFALRITTPIVGKSFK